MNEKQKLLGRGALSVRPLYRVLRRPQLRTERGKRKTDGGRSRRAREGAQDCARGDRTLARPNSWQAGCQAAPNSPESCRAVLSPFEVGFVEGI